LIQSKTSSLSLDILVNTDHIWGLSSTYLGMGLMCNASKKKDLGVEESMFCLPILVEGALGGCQSCVYLFAVIINIGSTFLYG